MCLLFCCLQNKKKSKTMNAPFKTPYKKGPHGHVCKDCFDKWDEVEKKLFFLGNRVQELEASWLEALEEEDSDESVSLGSQDSKEEVVDIEPNFSRKRAKVGYELLQELHKENKKK